MTETKSAVSEQKQPAPQAVPPATYNSYAFNVALHSDQQSGDHLGERVVVFAQTADDASAFIVQQFGSDLVRMDGPTTLTTGGFLAQPSSSSTPSKSTAAAPVESADQHEKKQSSGHSK